MTSPYTEEEIAKRIAASMEIGAIDFITRGGFSETSIYYMSFVDGKWLGGCFIKADTVHEALLLSHQLGINPGGEVAFAGPLPIDAIKPGYEHRLITDKDELEAADNPDCGQVVKNTGPVHDR